MRLECWVRREGWHLQIGEIVWVAHIIIIKYLGLAWRRMKNHDPDYIPNEHPESKKPFYIQKLNKKLRKNGYSESLYETGRWSTRQNNIYKKFLLENRHLFETQFKRRSNKVFQKLARLLRHQRGSQQCRSHHQKMLLKAGATNLDEMIRYLQKQFESNPKQHELEGRPTFIGEDNQIGPEQEVQIFIEKNRRGLQIFITFDLNSLQTWECY